MSLDFVIHAALTVLTLGLVAAVYNLYRVTNDITVVLKAVVMGYKITVKVKE
jgi:hypothetical protein